MERVAEPPGPALRAGDGRHAAERAALCDRGRAPPDDGRHARGAALCRLGDGRGESRPRVVCSLCTVPIIILLIHKWLAQCDYSNRIYFVVIHAVCSLPHCLRDLDYDYRPEADAADAAAKSPHDAAAFAARNERKIREVCRSYFDRCASRNNALYHIHN